MRARAYVDGFNLYNGALKGKTGTKWLDLSAFAQALVPDDQVDAVRYFTARITPKANTRDAVVRQDRYLAALARCADIEVTEGHFSFKKKNRRRWDNRDESVSIVHIEEKGSDVNLAAYLLRDGFMDLYEKAVVISNDSDLAEAIRIVRDELGKPVVVVNPHKQELRSGKLAQVATTTLQVFPRTVRACQFPDPLVLGTATFRKPENW